MFDPNGPLGRLLTSHGRRSREEARTAGRRRVDVARFLAELLPLEDRCMMSADPVVPLESVKPLGTIFWNGGGATNPSDPPPQFLKTKIAEAPTEKTITLTNASDQTIYPILRGANTGKLNTNEGRTGNPQNLYDPQDYVNQEYRAYVGYVDAQGIQRLGLPAHATVTFRVPLVFWTRSGPTSRPMAPT